MEKERYFTEKEYKSPKIIRNLIDSLFKIFDVKAIKKETIKIWDTTRRLDKANPERIEKFDDNTVKISIKAWDHRDWSTERTELQDKEKQKFWEEYLYKFSFKIPENFPLIDNRLVLWQWKYCEPEWQYWDPVPMLSQRIKKFDWEYYFVITDGNRNIIWNRIPIKDIQGKYINMEYKLKFSNTWKSYAKIKWEIIDDNWKKEINIFEGDFNEWLNETNGKWVDELYFKFWLYRDRYKYWIKKIKHNRILTKDVKKKEINEIKQAMKLEQEARNSKKLPMCILFKDYSVSKVKSDLDSVSIQRKDN